MNDLLQRLTGLRITRPSDPVEEFHDAEEHINMPVANVPVANAPVVNDQPFIMPAPQVPVAQLPVVQLPIAQLPIVVLPVIQLPAAQPNHLNNADVQEHIRAISWTDAGRRYNLTRRAFRNACNNPQMEYARSNVQVIKRDLAFIRSILRQERNINQLSPAQLAWLEDIQARVVR